jgi:mRNA interferase MazF
MRKLFVTFNQYDVLLVPFPFTDKAMAKKRPALVISPIDFNKTTKHIIFAMITSAGNWAFDIEVGDLKAAGLTSPCKIRMKLFTLDASLVDKKIGGLGNQDRDVVHAHLRALLG